YRRGPRAPDPVPACIRRRPPGAGAERSRCRRPGAWPASSDPTEAGTYNPVPQGVRAMKGIILSGGKGSRLRPFTYSGAKQLVPVGNVPVLHFPVRQMVEAGISEVALVVGETAPQIRAAMGDGEAFGARF